MMPRFFKDMPPNKPGVWIASAGTRSRFYGECVRYERKFKGSRIAYLFARLAALRLDWKYPSEGLSIWWKIKKDAQCQKDAL